MPPAVAVAVAVAAHRAKKKGRHRRGVSGLDAYYGKGYHVATTLFFKSRGAPVDR